jgi:hypothetical protein
MDFLLWKRSKKLCKKLCGFLFWKNYQVVFLIGMNDMGYNRKVEGSSFPMVVLSGRMTLGTVRNDHLKMSFFLDETPPLLDNPLEFSNENFTN